MRDLIPVGTSYYSFTQNQMLYGDGITRFPEPTEGDNFETKDYTYIFWEIHTPDANRVGWSANVKDKMQKKYQPLMETINGYPLFSVNNLFRDCKSMIIAPIIPKTVQLMIGAFAGCLLLAGPPTIPDGVVNITGAFEACSSMSVAPIIPQSVQFMSSAFLKCSCLKGTLICNANPTEVNFAIQYTRINKIEGRCSEETKKLILSFGK